jgi:EAL domain-containing protein (putative c-di-GMP-specific phosphodiesterase class I)
LFRLVYQPIAPLHGNTVEKYEALLRLYCADSTIIPASRFVPLAEQGGLMQSIDHWVVETVVKLLRERGNATSLFVKISSASIQDGEFPAWLKAMFDRYGYPDSRLIFEICEPNIRAGLLYVERFANLAKQLGCGLALDHNDMGRDVAPFLERIPASYVKINGQALADIAFNHERQMQLEQIISAAEKYRARVITGFVENAGNLQLLWKSGVHYIQGNFLQEPAEVLDFNFGEESAG